MKKNFISVMVASVILASSGVQASGIPVFDGAAALNFVQQLTQLKQQYIQMKQTAESLKGINSIGGLLSNPAIRDYMPEDLKGAYDEVGDAIFKGQSGQYKGLEGAIDAIEDAASKRKTWEDIQTARAQKAKMDAAMMSASYTGAIKRLESIEALMSKVGSTPTAKESQDLTSRIASEQAIQQNEMQRLNLMVAMQKAQDRLLEEETKEMAKKSVTGGSGSIPRL